MSLTTEFAFTLPKGFVDEHGKLHREGAMRMATALDEITPLRDPRVRQNEAYLVVILLAQVITRLGSLTEVKPEHVEQFFSADIAYLQDLYRRINDVVLPTMIVTCPHCQQTFEQEVPLLGES